MGLFHLVEQHDAVGMAAHGLRKLAALVIAHIARRSAYQAGHGVLLHVFAHIYAHHIGLIVKQGFRQSLGKLGLAYAGRP